MSPLSHHSLGNLVLMDSKSTVRVFSKIWKLRNLCGRSEDVIISPEEHADDLFCFGGHFRLKVSLVAQLVKNPPAMQETWF